MVPRCDKSELGPGETLLPPFLIPFPLNCDGATTFRTAQAVVTAYNNATYFSYVTVQILGFDPTVGGQFGLLGPVTTTMVAVDTQTGEELSATTEGVREIANVTMAADEATLISNNFGFLTQGVLGSRLDGLQPVLPQSRRHPALRPAVYVQALGAEALRYGGPGWRRCLDSFFVQRNRFPAST